MQSKGLSRVFSSTKFNLVSIPSTPRSSPPKGSRLMDTSGLRKCQELLTESVANRLRSFDSVAESWVQEPGCLVQLQQRLLLVVWLRASNSTWLSVQLSIKWTQWQYPPGKFMVRTMYFEEHELWGCTQPRPTSPPHTIEPPSAEAPLRVLRLVFVFSVVTVIWHFSLYPPRSI